MIPSWPATTWLLIRGLARESGHWLELTALLRRRTFPDQVVVVDIPGNGRLHRQRTPSTVPAIARSLQDLPTALGRSSRLVLVGLSLGAMVSLEWARQIPHRVAGLVVVNASLGRLCPPWMRIRPSAWLEVGRTLLSPGRVEQEQRILQLTSAHRAADASTLRRALAIQRERPVHRRNAVRQLMAAATYRPRKLPSLPTLVLASRNDELVNVDCSRRLAMAMSAALDVHPSAGHDLPLDDPQWCVDRMLRWRELELGRADGPAPERENA